MTPGTSSIYQRLRIHFLQYPGPPRPSLSPTFFTPQFPPRKESDYFYPLHTQISFSHPSRQPQQPHHKQQPKVTVISRNQMYQIMVSPYQNGGPPPNAPQGPKREGKKKRQRSQELQPPKKPNAKDKKEPPSPESGGIPNPTPEYLSLASEPSFSLPSPRRILLVLDLNGTMLHRKNKKQPTNFITRPYAPTFLRYLIDTFYVAIWSSARSHNVQAMVKSLLPDEEYRSRLVTIWARDKLRLSKSDYDTKVQCYKRLAYIWDDPGVIASHPQADIGRRWSQADTVLIDDSYEKGRSEPHNLIEIPEFSGTEAHGRPILPQVHDYINNLASQSNLSSYMRTRPFQSE